MGIVEYEPGSPFPGVIGRTTDESSTAWPAPVRARQGVPNVLTIVLDDDTGYGQMGRHGARQHGGLQTSTTTARYVERPR